MKVISLVWFTFPYRGTFFCRITAYLINSLNMSFHSIIIKHKRLRILLYLYITVLKFLFYCDKLLPTLLNPGYMTMNHFLFVYLY